MFFGRICGIDTLTGCRLLMVRELARACLNHFLEVDMKFYEYDEYSWVWKASDFSLSEIFEGKFRVIFDNAETAAMFKRAIDAAQVSEVL